MYDLIVYRVTVLRPHPPKKALTVNVIVIADCYGEMQPCIYHPATDKWYLLPPTECRRLSVKQIGYVTVSCGGKVFFLTDDITRSQWYDPGLQHRGKTSSLSPKEHR